MVEPADSAVVIGAGLAGLSAAYRLSAEGWRVSVLEKEREIGGRSRTVSSDGFIFDTGAQQCKDSYDAVLKTAIELGLGERFRVPMEASGCFLRGRLHTFHPRARNPSLMAPWKALGANGPRDIFAVAVPLIRRYRSYNIRFPEWWTPLGDETASDYFMGKASSGFQNGVLEAICLHALGSELNRTSAAGALAAIRTTFTDRRVGFTTGAGTIADAMARKVDVKTGTEVESVVIEDGTAKGVRVRTYDGRSEILQADGVICAVPGLEVPGLCAGLGSAARELLAESRHSPSLVINMAFEETPATLADTVLMSPDEGFLTSWACTGTSKASEYAPEGFSVATTVISGSAASALLDEDDEELVKRAARESARVFGYTTDTPVLWRVHRHTYGRPVIGPGHARRVRDLMRSGSGVRNLELAGDWMRSPTMEGAISSGFLAAQSLAERAS